MIDYSNETEQVNFLTSGFFQSSISKMWLIKIKEFVYIQGRMVLSNSVCTMVNVTDKNISKSQSVIYGKYSIATCILEKIVHYTNYGRRNI